MTAIRGYVPPTTDRDAIGVHSLDHFVLAVPDLKPATTYYYTVDSLQGNGKSDGVKSPVRHFTNPADPQHAPAASAGRKDQ